MDPPASSDDPVVDAANAFAAAEQVDTTDVNTLAVNQGITSAETLLQENRSISWLENPWRYTKLDQSSGRKTVAFSTVALGPTIQGRATSGHIARRRQV